MGKLSRADVLKMANLARLELSEAEIVEFTEEMSSILKYVEILQDVDVSGLKPTNQVTGLENVTRADEIIDYGYQTSDLLKNVPSVEASQIKVQRMIV